MAKDEQLARSARGEADRQEPSLEDPSFEDALSEYITAEDASSTTVEKTFDSFSSSISRPLTKQAADFEGRRLGTYEIRELLGKGGVGLVYLAFDQRLRRNVALKLLRTDDPEAAHRLLDEARAQARVEHENVCQVYEAGEVNGQTYIAMQYIEGQPLTRAFRDMTLEEKVRVIQKVAEGLETAHALNLIHRDVKPGNILVEKTPRGEWKPYILDFGLAREQAAPGETTTGEVKGTPSYMPPEQVTGQIHVLDARADIYSLGATFYEGMAQRQLFPDTSGGLAVMLKVLNEDPEPLRAVDKTIPVDIESIILRCLEKDPERRYASARELAEDLQRFLDGEPIRARAIGPVIRLWRRLKKRRVAALTVGLVLTVLSSAGVLIWSQIRHRQRTALMEEYRQDVRYVDGLISHEYELKIHDVTGAKKKVRRRLAEIRQSLDESGRLARGPASYALGRGHLALHEYEEAYAYLKTAWDEGTRDPEVSYALGRTLGALYEKELEVARRLRDEQQRQERLAEIDQLYREPALDRLREAGDIEADSVELVEALIELWEGRHDAALAKAAVALDRLPWLYEALLVQGDVYASKGQEAYNGGNYEEALAAYLQAQEKYGEAEEQGQSDVRIYEAQCNLGVALVTLKLYGRVGEAEEAFRYGLESCEKARLVDAERAESFEIESRLNWRMGEYAEDIGLDPTRYLSRAIEVVPKALEIKPENVETYASLGWSQALLASWQLAQGLDLRSAVDAALQAFRECLRLDRHLAQCHSGLGYSLSRLAEWKIASSEDAGNNVASALQSLERAVAIESRNVYAQDNLGHAYIIRARWELLRGEDLTFTVAQAQRVFSDIEAINPRYFYAHYGTYDALSYLIRYRLSRNEDPTAEILRARAALERAADLNPEYLWPPFDRGRLVTFEGQWESMRGGGDPEPLFEQAREMLDDATRSLPEAGAWGHQLQAELDLIWARYLVREKRPASDVIRHGMRVISQGLEIDSSLVELWALEGALRLQQAKSERDAAKRRRLLEAAREALGKAFEGNSNLTFKYQPVLDRIEELD